MMVWHWVSREVHCPEMHCRPPEQESPSERTSSLGQEGPVPEQRSSGSHSPVEGRQTSVVGEKRQLVQQSSLESSHSALLMNLQVVGLQQVFPPHLPNEQKR